MKLKGKTAIVTGAAAGIGKASTELFASEGAHILAIDLDGGKLEHLASKITSSGGICLALRGDVSQSADVQNALNTAIGRFGKIDILFNNAGIVPAGKIDVTTEEQWDRAMAINVKSMYLFCHAIVPHFKEHGGGVILNTASATALRAVVDRACYTATKAAVVGLTKSMALDYVRDNIRVNCLCPGTVDTPSLSERLAAFPDPAEAKKNFIARQPMGRFGTAEEIALAALYLVSDESAFVTGVAFAIDGGLTI
ncbi:short-chain dehydrogenase/reductase SDR [Candidatus Koribacter versatilis Ellin345]|uniref:Short-chain dehydrogenase/reductase SDR n=1 Tax=Koribacter versatilis (strain Ellin345) TaxID=204669 RepID=Q1IU03_KORVE|nr:glucose 1-dehydrogenase [Candidatus Koribacter versatilis]ABF39647.1 short-chain dehydrogenase/reductase SDR [Candidatus Koribacter versatilis Ellin345]